MCTSCRELFLARPNEFPYILIHLAKILQKERRFLIASMTGYGRAETVKRGTTVTSEVRCVNNRFLDVAVRMPRQMSHREHEVKELVRNYISRGKLNISLTISKETDGSAPLKVNTSVARSYYKLLNDLRKSVKIREQVKLEHLLQFSEVFDVSAEPEDDDAEWEVVQEALSKSLDALNEMRAKEGGELNKDLTRRIQLMGEIIVQVEQLSKENIQEERTKLEEKVRQIITDPSSIDSARLELEIVLLADKLDVTEECVRFRSHEKFFLEGMASKEPAGRKLNFLMQEMNREANTIASKSSDASISRLMVNVKEELERIREQLQNIE